MENNSTNQKLIELYMESFRKAYNESGRTYHAKNAVHRIRALANRIRNTYVAPDREDRASELHQEVNYLASVAFSVNSKELRKVLQRELVPALIDMDLAMISELEMDALDEVFWDELSRDKKHPLSHRSVAEIFRQKRAEELRKQIMELVPARPEMEFPEAMAMERKFILHVGGTNCGKTYRSLERLKTAEKGVYLGPLRLLALEVYERMHDAGVPCTMLTGQECIEDEDSHIISATVEMLDLDEEYDVAVIDEAQMVADEDRGHSWTRAILGVRAKEIHVCMSPNAEEVVKHLIQLTGDTYEVNHYERMTALALEEKPMTFPDDAMDGDAFIVFSKRAVLDVAARLEAVGVSCSVIYGSLPPEIRRRQMEMFLSGEHKVVVSTDAIGMGLNLPVRRIVFMETDKYDGKNDRPLTVSEIRQIAGRAGRFGIYETGYVTALDEDHLDFLRQQMAKEDMPIYNVSLGFPQVLLSMKAPMDVVLKLWKDAETPAPFEKINIEEILFLYTEAVRLKDYIPDFENAFMLYRMVTCPIDIKDAELVRQWGEYCMNYAADIELEKPNKNSRYKGLQKYESYYRKLDLYYQFSMRMGKIPDVFWLMDEREKTQDTIMSLLAKDKKEYILRCKYCGKVLPVDSPFRVCRNCRRNYR